VIVFFYGGSWNSGEREAYSFVGRALAARGFLVAVADYRLVPEVRFPAFLEDCAAAVRWVVAHAAGYGGDGARVVLAGHSAGAYNAAMLALDPRWLGAARSAVRGLVGLAGPYDFLPLDSAVTRAAFGGAGNLKLTQPVHFGRADAVPALLLSGAEDRTVRPVQTKRLAERIGAEVRLYPGTGHVAILAALAMPLRRKAPVLADVARFAREVTSGG
jgi:acetyl esterase/lipase